MITFSQSERFRTATPRMLGTCLLSLLLVMGLTAGRVSAQLYGDGSDGSYTVLENETLTSHKNYINLTVSAGVTLNTGGFDVRVDGTLTNNGTITDSQSGGAGGPGGNPGTGGVTSPGGTGLNGGSGVSGASGAGNGGNGGGGGGGGGGAFDGDDNEFAPGGNGGRGGNGGKGGGRVRVYARQLANNGVIHADGFPGQAGLNGQSGNYTSYTETIFINRDLAGGGGAGGGGGNGGNGGSVVIVYKTLFATGTVRAQGGGPGGNGVPGNGPGTQYSAGSNTFEYNGGVGGGFDADGGTGGRGEMDSNGGGNGAAGQSGQPGMPGSISLTQSSTCYVDIDSDGFGDIAHPGTDVTSPCGAGFSANNLDCHDGLASVYPGAPEIPNDGIDQDCDGADLITSCCAGRVGDANGAGGDEPTIGDVSTIIDALFITGDPGVLPCLAEADLNQSGSVSPIGTDITIGDLSILIDYLFLTGPYDATTNPAGVVLPDCL